MLLTRSEMNKAPNLLCTYQHTTTVSMLMTFSFRSASGLAGCGNQRRDASTANRSAHAAAFTSQTSTLSTPVSPHMPTWKWFNHRVPFSSRSLDTQGLVPAIGNSVTPTPPVSVGLPSQISAPHYSTDADPHTERSMHYMEITRL